MLTSLMGGRRARGVRALAQVCPRLEIRGKEVTGWASASRLRGDLEFWGVPGTEHLDPLVLSATLLADGAALESDREVPSSCRVSQHPPCAHCNRYFSEFIPPVVTEQRNGKLELSRHIRHSHLQVHSGTALQ